MEYLRIKKKKEFDKILKSGKRAHAESLSVIYLPDKNIKMAVCVGKKFGKSVQRNRIKRLLREAYRPFCARLKPGAVLLIPRVREEYSYSAFSRDLQKLFSREKIFED